MGTSYSECQILTNIFLSISMYYALSYGNPWTIINVVQFPIEYIGTRDSNKYIS